MSEKVSGMGRLIGWVDARHTIAISAVAAFLLRLPGLTRPVRADEAGFTLVARAWDPSPEHLYGPFFVDRPPLLIAIFRGSDDLGGPLFIRVLGALACALLVVLAAWTARLVADERSARWTAVCVATITSTTVIDAVAVKGELLGLPFVMAACALTLLAVRRRSAWLALLAGLAAGTAPHIKQNLVGGLVFAAVLLLASGLTRVLRPGEVARLTAAGLVGASVTTVATIAWALSAGVHLDVLWYDLVGFRSDAASAIAAGSPDAPVLRAGVLLLAALVSGLLIVVGGFVWHVRELWSADRALTAATAALLVTDTLALVYGGSFWRDYLFPLVPGAALAAALLVTRPDPGGRRMRAVVLGAAVSALACLVGWSVLNAAGLQEFHEHDTGVAIEAAAEPGDTLVVFGGRADLQLASGLRSPYEHLWSLPMRTLDPDLDDLDTLVAGPDAPTWLVEWVGFTTWSEDGGARLRRLVEERYDVHGAGCDGRPVYLLRGLDRGPVAPNCGETVMQPIRP
ncbi:MULTISPECIES: glycosyltransferase family 39 protein [unclassified Nocardioides]|uniref:glycosyltransferase family 39 protein n=1 Tax=unclassified Nocardioides TaxID=2615069 RepID=UPI003015834B